jgi:pyruvate formate lyase activating enzyme
LVCGKEDPLISSSLSLCLGCIRKGGSKVEEQVGRVHARARGEFHLPPAPPREPEGVRCKICANRCLIPEGGTGYCGLRSSQSGRLVHLGGTKSKGILDWYYDALPTNCVADWVCPGGTEAGFSQYSYRRGPERGYKNLAVFYRACTFDCLFCQNWHFKQEASRAESISADQLASQVDEHTSCVCYFGGDPAAQMPHALAASRLATGQARKQGRILRICWETNGSMSRPFLQAAAELSLASGGCIKFDLKAFDNKLHYALTGATNGQTLGNFAHLAGLIPTRPDPPFLVASTLLVPGYIDADEVFKIARFIASLDKNIPYSLLGFYPHFHMRDLPTTARQQAHACVEAATAAGLTRVHIGNIHLLR